jgi:hypothetical protein
VLPKRRDRHIYFSPLDIEIQLDDKPGAVERAFQIADSGRVATVREIKRVLTDESYLAYEISGPTLSRQLGERIKKAKGNGLAA